MLNCSQSSSRAFSACSTSISLGTCRNFHIIGTVPVLLHNGCYLPTCENCHWLGKVLSLPVLCGPTHCLLAISSDVLSVIATLLLPTLVKVSYSQAYFITNFPIRNDRGHDWISVLILADDMISALDEPASAIGREAMRVSTTSICSSQTLPCSHTFPLLLDSPPPRLHPSTILAVSAPCPLPAACL